MNRANDQLVGKSARVHRKGGALRERLQRQLRALAWSLLLIAGHGAWAQGQSFPPGGQSPVPGTSPIIVPGGSTPINQCGPGGLTPGEPGCARAGNPLNVMAGNKYQREEDMPALPGVLGLELVRHYNSDFSGYREGTGSSSSSVGRGWRLGYDGWLRLPEGAKGKRLGPGEIPVDETITFSGPDGTQVPLQHLSTGAAGASEWAPAGCGGTLLRIDPSNAQVPFVLRNANGLQRHFDDRGRQVRIQAVSGHTVRIERDTHGRITRVIDPQGRQLVLNYPEAVTAQGQGNSNTQPRVIRQAQHIDTPLGRYSYHFGQEAHDQQAKAGALIPLAQLQAQATSLVRVQHPDGSARHYHHEDPRAHSLLTGISVQASTGEALQREVSWAYDRQGRAVRSVKGPIPHVPDEGQRGVQDVSLRFLGPQGGQRRDGSGVTVLTNSLGEHTRYEYAMLGGQRQLTLVQGAGCSSCGPVNVRYGHDSLGRQVSVTELSPAKVDEDGQVQGTAQPLNSRQLTLDPQGRVLRVEHVLYQGGKEVGKDLIEERSYGDARWPHQPTRIKRPSVVAAQEHTVELSYNAAGQVEQVRESGFSPLDAQGRLPQPGQVGQTLERTSRYIYQTIGGHSVLVQADGPLSNGTQNDSTDSDITRYKWDDSGNRLLSITHPMGLSERFEHDSATGRLLARTDALGVRTEVHWAPHAQRVEQVRRAGVQVDIEHDSHGRVSRYRRNDGAQIGVEYDLAQGQIRYTLPDGEVKEMRHDSEGRPIASQWQDGQGQVLVGGTKIEYEAQDAQGLRELRIQAPTGVQTTLRWDPLAAQRQAQRGQGAGRLNQTERFDAAQHLLQVQRNEATTRLQRDQHNASASLELPHGATHRQWKDDFGRVVRIEHPDSGVHRDAYDEADRQTARWDSSRYSSARYDALGRLIQLRHANTDGASVQSASAVVKAVVQAEEETRWKYEGALMVRQTSSQQDKHFGYNANGQLVDERLSLRRQVSAEQSAASQSTDAWLPALVTRYERDALGRIQRIHLPEGAVLTQRHNAQGRIEAISLQAPASHWWERVIRWVWAEQGTTELITQIEHSSSRGLRGYQHANGAQVSSTHDQAGRLTRWSDGPLQTELGFNQHAQLSTLKLEGPVQPGQGGPTRAAAQALQQEFQQRAQQLSYDPFGRLKALSESGQTQRFEHDLNGNRTAQSSETLGQLTFALAPQSDRLLSVQNNQGQAQRSYRYNSAGEPVRIETEADTRTLHYNALGQIGAVERGANGTNEVNGQTELLAHYAYNGARQRVAKTVAQPEGGHATTYFTWHRGLLDAELDSQGRIERRVIYFNLRPVALLAYGYAQDKGAKEASRPQRTQRFAIHGDHLGTPQVITDDQQRVVWLARYDAFGRATAQGLPHSEVTAQNRSGRASGNGWIGTAHAAGNPDKPFEFHLRFTGQYEDSETGWHYNWRRYYEPETGRYLTPDPIGLRGGVNAFGYAGGDPLGAVDPWGLYTVYWGGAGLDGAYIDDQIEALRDAGIENVQRGVGSGGPPPFGMGLDANAVINLRTYPPRYGFITPRAPYAGDPCRQMRRSGEQVNYIGYSYGSLLAAHTAMHYANQGNMIDNLVLIGSPIDENFLSLLRTNPNIRNVTVINLTQHGDRIYSGMSEMELVQAVPSLLNDVFGSNGEGHFYYGDTSNPTVGSDRRRDLAEQLHIGGLR